MKKLLLLAMPAVALASPAYAQEAAGGLRVEGVIFYEDVDSDIDANLPRKDEDVDIAFGVGVGYDFIRTGPLDLGVDAEFTESTANREIYAEGGTIPLGEIDFGNEFYVGGRVTGRIAGPWKAHAKLGYSSLKTSFSTDIDDLDIDDDLPDGNFDLDERLSGYRAAIGIAYGDDDDRTYYGVEYRYSKYERDVSRNQIGVFVGARF